MEKERFSNPLIKKIVSLSKRRGFVFQSSAIYGGVAGLWDFGYLGVLMKKNIENLWIKKFIKEKENIFLIEGTVLMHPKVWEASGHLEHFTDPLIECKNCHSRFREDQLLEEKKDKAKKVVQCPVCGKREFTEPRRFNLMFKTFLGVIEEEANLTFLRPETAQSMFLNFENVLKTSRLKLPFGIGQIGRCFRNEITLGDFIFRAREFTIAEIEFFVEPKEDEKWFDFWVREWENFFLELGLKKENLRKKEHKKEDLAHYAKRTVDIEYKFPFGWAEIAGIANRTDYDLKRHSKFSGRDLRYYDQQRNEKFFPYVIEPTLGIERVFLAILSESYSEIKGGRTKTTKATKEIEILLKLPKKIAPIKVAVFPLVRNKKEIVKKAREVYQIIKPHFFSQYDQVGSIGRRYRRADEIGIPYCLTIDFESLRNNDLTVRDRDTMKQERVKIKEIVDFLKEKLEN